MALFNDEIIIRGEVAFLKLVGPKCNRPLCFQNKTGARLRLVRGKKMTGAHIGLGFENLKNWWGPGPSGPLGDATPE